MNPNNIASWNEQRGPIGPAYHPPMPTIRLKKATIDDQALVIAFDHDLDQKEHVELKRGEKIAKAISNGECLLILADNQAVGFVIFDYRFFDLGWIELMVIEEKQRGKGIGVQVLALICEQSKTNKVFTSTNRSNFPMQQALAKAGFAFAGEITGLDEGDPELFYVKTKGEERTVDT
jgi:RimJ/RimL family protein N-acetyltransferase